MWNSDIEANSRADYIATILSEAMSQYELLGNIKSFDKVLMELRKQYPECSEAHIVDILASLVSVYSLKKSEKSELVVTAPESFKVKASKTKNVVADMITSAQKSIVMTGYSISDYFKDLLDLIIGKSQSGVYIRIYVNDIEKQKQALERLLAYQSKHLQLFEYIKSEEDKMAALHAKMLIVDSSEMLISSANLSYHGMAGNVEIGLRVQSTEKARELENIFKELVKMKVMSRVEF